MASTPAASLEEERHPPAAGRAKQCLWRVAFSALSARRGGAATPATPCLTAPPSTGMSYGAAGCRLASPACGDQHSPTTEAHRLRLSKQRGAMLRHEIAVRPAWRSTQEEPQQAPAACSSQGGTVFSHFLSARLVLLRIPHTRHATTTECLVTRGTTTTVEQCKTTDIQDRVEGGPNRRAAECKRRHSSAGHVAVGHGRHAARRGCPQTRLHDQLISRTRIYSVEGRVAAAAVQACSNANSSLLAIQEQRVGRRAWDGRQVQGSPGVFVGTGAANARVERPPVSGARRKTRRACAGK